MVEILIIDLFLGLLPPATKLGQGYVFTRVCDSVHRGVSVSVPGGGISIPGGSLSWAGVSAQRGPCHGAGGRYTSYWNAF